MLVYSKDCTNSIHRLRGNGGATLPTCLLRLSSISTGAFPDLTAAQPCCSQGQFICAKFLFDHVQDTPEDWTLDRLSQLPDGLTQMYRYQLDTMHAALMHERPDLATTLRDRLLPVLSVMKEAVPVQFLAWLVQSNEEDVSDLRSHDKEQYHRHHGQRRAV